MSVNMWAYDPDKCKCEGVCCCGDCDSCESWDMETDETDETEDEI